ncbi:MULTISPECIES: hypothetical protein [Streptomyces]|nr:MULTISPECIES: hypothetical protein [Streptomyces]MDW8470904.1 hypothetical protein [Streptomyces scabiei]MDX2569663.1 hypothetical protein [Streptomyces scabiei]MDX2628450.1 hypothetical protein [Streptomyces scabiei]MDX2832006.1 hypothetical protein [Streptomyces scabiei]MDX3150448.1 hypothetical protein [Streptomyces scabiei]
MIDTQVIDTQAIGAQAIGAQAIGRLACARPRGTSGLLNPAIAGPPCR